MAKSGAGMVDVGAAILRLALGVIYAMHGYQALLVLGPSGTAAFQKSLGLPFPELGAWYLIVAHALGGVMLILGIFTRWAALANVPIMFVAVLLVHLKQGFFMGSGGGYEFSLLVLAATIAQTFLGGGALAFRP